MENLPSDITLDILSRLTTIESVLQCKRVCKTWRTLLGGTTSKVGLLYYFSFPKKNSGIQLFYREQIEDSNIIIDDDDKQQGFYKPLMKIDHELIRLGRTMANFVMVGSCNGLVCFILSDELSINDPVYICNPVTREKVQLPRICKKGIKCKWSSCMASGFGYCHSTNEYKVVRIFYHDVTTSDGRNQMDYLLGEVQIYTLGDESESSGWRNIGEIKYIFNDELITPGVFANGALHWIDYTDKYRVKIVAFDLETEEFRVLPSPPCYLGTGSTLVKKLVLLGGNLCVSHEDPYKCMEIWAFKENKTRKNCSTNYELKEREYQSWSWSKEFKIALEDPFFGYYFEPFAVTKSNEVLLWYGRQILYCYDPKTSTLKKLSGDSPATQYAQAIPHMNSLVSLKALGQKSVKEEICIN